jgi:hypothetical protein
MAAALSSPFYLSEKKKMRKFKNHLENIAYFYFNSNENAHLRMLVSQLGIVENVGLGVFFSKINSFPFW